MSAFGKLYFPTIAGQVYPSARKIMAAAALNNLTLETPEFEMSKTNKTPEFLAKFPLGKIPAFESASSDFKLWESDAIAYHVAQSGPRAAQLLGATPEAKAKIQQWVHFTAAHCNATIMALGRWRFGFGAFDAEAEQKSLEELDRWAAHIEGQLAGRKWLVGDALSMADLSIASFVYLGTLTVMDAPFRSRFPETFRWYDSVRNTDELKELFAGQMLETKLEKPEEKKEEA